MEIVWEMYDYKKERPWVLTKEGQKAVLLYRDVAIHMLYQTGAFMEIELQKQAKKYPDSNFPDSWKQLAVVDYLVELGDFVLVTPTEDRIVRQFYVYRKNIKI